MGELLEMSGIQHAYNGRRVLNDFSLILARGQIGCLLGPSGCGKTTALRCIAGFEHVAAGRIAVNGKEVSRPGRSVPPEERRVRSEEHTSELQSQSNLVCRLLLEKKKDIN